MIISKPKFQALFSLTAFLIIIFGIIGYILYKFSGQTYQYIILGLLIPVALSVLLKVMLSYKIAEVNKEKLKLKYPFKFYSKQYSLNKDLENWTETKMKASGQDYKALTLFFKDKKKIQFSYLENTSYNALVKYMRKKYARQEKKS